MLIMDLPDAARITMASPAGACPDLSAREYTLETTDNWWDRLHELGYLKAQVAAVQDLIARTSVSGQEIAKALNVKRL